MPIVVAALFLVALVVAGGVWWYLRDDAPAKVDLDTAAASVTTVPGERTTALPGVWRIDTSTGSFDFTKATGTFAGFRVNEELSNIGAATAVGRTGSVDGSLRIVGTKVTEATFSVDLTTIKTDRSMRDGRVQQALQTDRFPNAKFTLTDPIALPTNAASGSEIEVEAKGKLAIHGVTHDVTIPLQAKLVGPSIVVVGSIGLKLSDYGVTAPSAPIVVSVADHATMEFQLLFTKR